MLISDIDWEKNPLIPCIAQEASTRQALMLAYVDREALERTFSTGFAHYHSRSRKKLWKKGESSGHTQKIVEIRVDCDLDALLYIVEQTGAACHTGSASCFYRTISKD